MERDKEREKKWRGRDMERENERGVIMLHRRDNERHSEAHSRRHSRRDNEGHSRSSVNESLCSELS